MIFTVWFIRVYIIIIYNIRYSRYAYEIWHIYYHVYRTINYIILENFKKKNVVHNEYWRNI